MFYLLQDHLHSSSALAAQNGTLSGARNYYYPFGGSRGGAAFNSLTTKRFTGQYHEQSIPGGEGLSYYGARWYDARLGRFVTPDSIVPQPDNPQDFNRYSYVRNNPLKYTDPSGHSARLMHDGGGTRPSGLGPLGQARTGTRPGFSGVGIPGYQPKAGYSQWNNPASLISGCQKCHAAVANGKAALTDEELAAVSSQMWQRQAWLIKSVARVYDPIDYLYFMEDCSDGCELQDIYWTLTPLIPGTISRSADEIVDGADTWLGRITKKPYYKKGYLTITTDLPGDSRTAAQFYMQLGGEFSKPLDKITDPVITSLKVDGHDILVVYRPISVSGTPAIEIWNNAAKTHEKIHFNPPGAP